MVGGRRREVCAADRVAVHRGIVGGGELAVRADGLGEHPVAGIRDRDGLRAEQWRVVEDDLQRLGRCDSRAHDSNLSPSPASLTLFWFENRASSRSTRQPSLARLHIN